MPQSIARASRREILAAIDVVKIAGIAFKKSRGDAIDQVAHRGVISLAQLRRRPKDRSAIVEGCERFDYAAVRWYDCLVTGLPRCRDLHEHRGFELRLIGGDREETSRAYGRGRVDKRSKRTAPGAAIDQQRRFETRVEFARERAFARNHNRPSARANAIVTARQHRLAAKSVLQLSRKPARRAASQ
jgi:hypothetical protein